MISAAYVAELASYNRWQNEKLYPLCDGLDPEVRHADQGLFFGSIFATLRHIWRIDALLLRYVRDGVAPTSPIALPDDWPGLTRERRVLDAAIDALSEAADDAWLAERLDFWGGKTLPRALLVVQMFNHQTHHRSQVTSALHRLGIDYGNTDLPFSPLSTLVESP